MEPKVKYDLVGGIAAVVLYPTSAPLPDEPTTCVESGGVGWCVPLDVGRASYVEQQLPQVYAAGARNTLVKHTLSFQSCCDELSLDLSEGVVADVKLGSGLTIRVGWSAEYGVDYPLRVSSVSFDSGAAPLDYPLKSWVLESLDTSVLV